MLTNEDRTDSKLKSTSTLNLGDVRAPATSGSPPPPIDEKYVEADVQDPEGDYDDDEWDTDPDNARNWSKSKKWIAVSIVSTITLVTYDPSFTMHGNIRFRFTAS